MNTAPPPSRFEERLLSAILTDFGQLTAEPGKRVRPARRHLRPGRRRGPLMAASAAAAAVAAAVTAVAVLPSGPGSSPGAGRSSAGTSPAGSVTPGHAGTGTPGPGIQTAAYVVHRMRSALAANHAVLRISDHAPDSQTGQPVWDVIWSSPDSHTTRTVDLAPDGHPVSGYLVTIWPRRTVSIVISYGSRTWSRTVYPFGSATPASGPAPRHETPAQGAARLRAEVASGQLTLVGPARVDGQRAIELQRGTAATGLLRMWVSPDTYLPIRTVSTPPGVPASSPQAIRDDYTWLPNTAASRRQLTRAAAIPAGFRQVSAS
ncbi:MAG TPA: hypothetical protein VGQ05_20475 [Streptosporangiaceae bacterium]|nr:hypothetical protein [Streptosporangiaceae bacterium]